VVIIIIIIIHEFHRDASLEQNFRYITIRNYVVAEKPRDAVYYLELSLCIKGSIISCEIIT